MIVEGARVVTGTDGSRGSPSTWVRVERGTIVEVGAGAAPAGDDDRLDAGGRWLGPGFVDAHIHGGFGVDVMDARAEDLDRVARGLVRHGVTSFLPTTYTASAERTRAALDAIESARRRQDDGPRASAEILGVNMEGPFLSVQRKGAHPEEELRDGSLALLDSFLDAALVRVMTVAPERPGAAGVMARLVERGVVVSIGHSDADAAGVREAIVRGARAVTHLFNGMRPLHHRDVGVVGAALLAPGLLCELIADGVHVSAEAMDLAWRMKGPRGLILVSDAGPHAGEGRPPEAAARLSDGTLASSVCMADTGLRRLRAATGADVPALWPAVSGNAAELLGLSGKGRVVPGADADLVVLDEDGNVDATFVRGELVHERPGARPLTRRRAPSPRASG
ncbi:N-acetylglucosamine-6-phosphate deacetylase [Microbacterium resistens]|uniref:N-acetylglucosamine-6-phosphate deacetylase n=1 Tax=Microbacterium resistens TaxID=156977 RepID=UPI001C59CAA2|nr:N-acetylglucosamine-6-phosphate deacetylase [Microbacterium resistens]MBW1639596.1 N-acetylglucosamine-6-phosphate deacetylase [Microbacterium resistens]